MMLKKIFHHVVLMLLMEYTIGNNPAGCIISTNPRDTVVFPNEIAEFNCAVDTQIQGATTFIVFTFMNGGSLTSLSMSQGHNGITWQSMMDGTIVTYDIQVIATEENNGLKIQCRSSCITQTAQLNIVNGPPLPPPPPSVTLPNLTTMSITWSPPWTYPVDNYTLMIQSDDDSVPVYNVTMVTESFLFHKEEQGSNDCEGMVYRFSVSAGTNVGNTGFSNQTIAVFPKDLLSIQQTLSVDMEEITCRSNSFFNITSMRPNVCSFEVLTYDFQVSSLEDNNIHRVIDVTVPDSTEPNGFFHITSTDHRESIQQFNITLTVTNQAGQSLSTNTIISNSSIRRTAFDGQGNVQHPRTTVALPGTVVNFTCSDDEDAYGLEINATRVNHINPDTIKTKYNDRGISWVEITSGSDTIGYTVSINASIELNGVSIQCFFAPCNADKAYLIVVSAPPGPLDAPLVTPTVSNTLVISWSPPWPHPVNEYTVFIRSNEITLNHTITDGQSYELMMESAMMNYSVCEDLYFSVEGSTDMGRIGRSNETKLGFIKGIDGIDIVQLQNISRSYNISTYYNGSMELYSITISIQPLQLDLCSYESLEYTITVVNNRTSDSITVDSMNISSTIVNLDYTNQHGDTLSVILDIYDDANQNISLTLFEAIILEVISVRPSSVTAVMTITPVMTIAPAITDMATSPSTSPSVSPTIASPHPSGNSEMKSQVSSAYVLTISVLVGIIITTLVQWYY